MQGRKIKQEASVEAQAMDLVQSKIEEKEKSIEEVDALYLPEGEKYNINVVLERAKFFQNQAATSLVELGKQLVLLKIHEPHGQFITAVEELGLSARSAQYAISAAEKFANTNTCSYLGVSKIKALSVLDDEDIKNLDEGKEVIGIGSLDDVERMTVKELKATIRAEREARKAEKDAQEKQVKALEGVVKKKESKISDLELENANRQPPTKQDIAQAKVDELQPEVFKYLRNAIYDIGVVIGYMDKVCRIEDVTIDQIMKLTEVMNPHLSEIKEAIDNVGDLFENAYPIKEEAPCTSDM